MPLGGPCVKTRPVGVGVMAVTEVPDGAESILPKPMRTGAVSESATTCPPMRLRTSSRACIASDRSTKFTNAQV